MFTKEMFEKWIALSYLKDNHYEGWELLWQTSPVNLATADDNLKTLNKAMINEYPFLLPRNRWTGEVVNEYDYEYNEWEALPLGWQIAFGWEFLNELAHDVKLFAQPENFRIEQIKEKYGELRIYVNWSSDYINETIEKYTELSTKVCITCGRPATYMSHGWISYYCDKHVPSTTHAEKIYK